MSGMKNPIRRFLCWLAFLGHRPIVRRSFEPEKLPQVLQRLRSQYGTRETDYVIRNLGQDNEYACVCVVFREKLL